jgi:hypothetical protein
MHARRERECSEPGLYAVDGRPRQTLLPAGEPGEAEQPGVGEPRQRPGGERDRRGVGARQQGAGQRARRRAGGDREQDGGADRQPRALELQRADAAVAMNALGASTGMPAWATTSARPSTATSR